MAATRFASSLGRDVRFAERLKAALRPFVGRLDPDFFVAMAHLSNIVGARWSCSEGRIGPGTTVGSILAEFATLAMAPGSVDGDRPAAGTRRLVGPGRAMADMMNLRQRKSLGDHLSCRGLQPQPEGGDADGQACPRT
jgi:hypothetical protein